MLGENEKAKMWQRLKERGWGGGRRKRRRRWKKRRGETEMRVEDPWRGKNWHSVNSDVLITYCCVTTHPKCKGS